MSVAGLFIEWAAFELMPVLVAEMGARAIQRAATDFGQRPFPERRQPPLSTDPGIHLVRGTTVLSHTPGRTRLSVVGLQNNTTAVEIVERRLQQIDGVLVVSANAVTGNVLVQYDPALTSIEDLRSAIETIGHGRITRAQSPLHEQPVLTLVNPQTV